MNIPLIGGLRQSPDLLKSRGHSLTWYIQWHLDTNILQMAGRALQWHEVEDKQVQLTHRYDQKWITTKGFLVLHREGELLMHRVITLLKSAGKGIHE